MEKLREFEVTDPKKVQNYVKYTVRVRKTVRSCRDTIEMESSRR